MAKHKTLKGLGSALIKIAARTEENVFNGVRKAALVSDQVAVLLTPVDTGYARSRWVVSIGEPVAAEQGIQKNINIGEEIATAIALTQAQAEIKKWKGQGSIFISNPLEYAIYLDEGSSEQAPAGMTKEAVHAGQQVLKELKLLD